jgi:hypothetical protein
VVIEQMTAMPLAVSNDNATINVLVVRANAKDALLRSSLSSLLLLLLIDIV